MDAKTAAATLKVLLKDGRYSGTLKEALNFAIAALNTESQSNPAVKIADTVLTENGYEPTDYIVLFTRMDIIIQHQDEYRTGVLRKLVGKFTKVTL